MQKLFLVSGQIFSLGMGLKLAEGPPGPSTGLSPGLAGGVGAHTCSKIINFQ